MERVAFLIEENNRRIGCLLNPESLVVRRRSGVRPRRSVTGPSTGKGLTDDPLVFTGGGTTEFDFELLFDVSLAGSTETAEDVRELTAPLWRLAENAGQGDAYRRPPLVRFIWGKSWNVPGVVVTVAERFERFSPEGMPRRSWMRLQFVRVNEPSPEAEPVRRLLEEEVPAPTGEEGGMHALRGGVPGPPPDVLGVFSDESADALIDAVLAETSVGEAITAAGSALAAAAETVMEDVDAWGSVDGEGEAGGSSGREQAAERIRSAMREVGAAMEEVAAASGSALFEAGVRAFSVVNEAAARVRAALEQSPEAPPGRIRKALDAIRRGGRRLWEGLQAAAREVKDRAGRVMARAAEGMEGAREKLVSIGRSVGAGASGAARRVGDLVEEAGALVAEMASEVWEAGRTLALEKGPAALERLGEALEHAWSVGAGGAERALRSAAETLAQSIRRARAATEALAAVALEKIADLVRTALEKAREALAADPDPDARDTLQAALVTAASGTEALLGAGTGTGEELPLRADLDILQAGPEAGETAALDAALERVASGLAAALADAERADAERLRSLASEPAGFEAPDFESARVGQGERLDQIAYRYYHDPAAWRLLARLNGIDRPLRLATGSLLRIPPSAPYSG